MTNVRNWLAVVGVSWMALAVPAAAQDGFQYEDDTATDDMAPDSAANDDMATDDAIEEDTAVSIDSGTQERPVHVTAGAKLGVGGNYLSSPSPKPTASLPFDDGVGGFGVGGGIFGEARFLDGHIGAELGFIFDSSTNWSKYTVNGTDFNPGWSALDLRMPVLINAGTSDAGTRVAVGTGPEFAFPLSASGEITGGGVNRTLTTNTSTHVNWLVNLGLSTPVGPVKVTFDVRFAYNLATPTTYAERYNVVSFTVVPQHEMDLRLLIGVAYDVLK